MPPLRRPGSLDGLLLFCVLIYAAAAKTPLRKSQCIPCGSIAHTASRSTTLWSGKSDGEEEQQPAALAQQEKKRKKEEGKRNAGFVHISWAAAALTDPAGRPSVRRREAEGPV